MRLNLISLPLEKYFLILVIIGIIGVYALSLIINKSLPFILFIETSVYLIPCIISIICLYYLFNKNKFKILLSKKIFYFNEKFLLTVFTLVFTFSIGILKIIDYRPWYYFAFISILFLIIFIQILSTHINPTVILLEICVVSLNLIYGITFKYPLFFSMTDTLDHISWSSYIFITGHILPKEYSLLYTNFPLYHIIVAISTRISGLGINSSLFLVTGLIFVGTVIFVYLFINFIIKSEEISLLSCLIYSNYSIIIYYGSYMVTRAMAYVGFVILLFLIFKIAAKTEKSKYYLVLNILIFLFLILVHPVSVPQFLIILIVMLICIVIFCQKKVKDFSALFLLVILFLAYWIFVVYDLASALIQDRLRSDYFEGILTNPSIISSTHNESIFFTSIIPNIAGGIFLLFGLLGLGYLLYKKKPRYSVIFAVLSICIIPFFVNTPLQSIYQINQIFGFYRFSLYIAPFMAFIMACGIIVILRVHVERKMIKKLLIVIVIFLFSLFSISSLTVVSVAGDSKDLYPIYPSTYFNNEELRSFSFFDTFIPNGDTIISDSPVDAYLFSKSYTGLETVGLPYHKNFLIPTIERIDQKAGYIFFRKGEFYRKGILNFKYMYFRYSPENAQIIESKLDNQEKIYSSGSNELFLKPY